MPVILVLEDRLVEHFGGVREVQPTPGQRRGSLLRVEANLHAFIS